MVMASSAGTHATTATAAAERHSDRVLRLDHLTQVGSTFHLGDGSGPLLKNGGVAFAAGSAGGWTPIGVEQTASGYEVAWKVAGSDQYGIWMTDSNGNFLVESRRRRLGQQHDLDVAGSELPPGSQWRWRHQRIATATAARTAR